MKKGITKKILIVIISAFLLVMPFSISAETYIDNISVIGSYFHFLDHGLSYNMSADISGKIKDNPTTFSIGARDLYLNYNEIDTTKYNINVHNYSNNALLGKFQAFEVSDGGVAYTFIHYISTTGQKLTCQDCYISIDNYSLLDNISNPNAINFSHTVNFDDLDAAIENKDFYSYVSGTYTNLGRYTGNNYIYPNFHFIFAIPKNVYNGSAASVNNSIQFYTNSGSHSFTSTTRRESYGGFNIYDITFNGQEGWVTFDIGVLNGKSLSNVMPIWFGSKDTMSSDLYASLYGNIELANNYLLNDISGRLATTNKLLTTNNQLTTTTNNLLTQIKTLFESGNAASQSSVNNADNSNSQLESSNDDFIQQQNSLNNQMNNNLNNINTNFNLMENQGFVSTAAWVRRRFNDLTSSTLISGNNAFGLMINFALIMGLALTILGKIRS